MASRPLAVQMYTLRDAVEQDYLGTLRAVAELGYGAVELVTLGSYSAAELRKELDTLGLQVPSMHVPLASLENELDTVISNLQTLGGRYVVCPWVAPEQRDSADGYRALAASLNDIGAKVKAAGLQLCYHNHDFEFQQFDGTTGMDILLDGTDADLVQSELDVYWVAYAGLNPVALIHSLADRVPLVHLKDMAADESRTFAEVGHGTLDIPGILAACKEVGVDQLVVEQDRCNRPPLESVGMSLEYLRSLGQA